MSNNIKQKFTSEPVIPPFSNRKKIYLTVHEYTINLKATSKRPENINKLRTIDFVSHKTLESKKFHSSTMTELRQKLYTFLTIIILSYLIIIIIVYIIIIT